MRDRFVKPETKDIPELQAGDTARWTELRREYLAHQIPGIIVRSLPVLARQAIFDLEGVREFSSLETPVAINCRPDIKIAQRRELGFHFDTGKNIPNSASTNRVVEGIVGVKLVEGTSNFTKRWGDGYKRYPVVPREAIEAYSDGLIDTAVFIPVAYTGQVGPFDVLFSRNRAGNVLAHDIASLTPDRLSFIQTVLLV